MIYSFKTLRNYLFLLPLILPGCTATQDTYYTEADYQKVNKADVHVRNPGKIHQITVRNGD